MSLGLYFDFHIPLALSRLIQDLVGNKNFDPRAPAPSVDTAVREWYSQPRTSQDPTIEVVTVKFKLPMSIANIAFDITRMSSQMEVWYQDRQNNWRQALDRDRVPLTLTLSTSSTTSWYTYSSDVYPIVAKAVQIRVSRQPDAALQGFPYPIGIRNTLIKRNVYTRNQGVQNFEDEQDSLGNVITKYIKDWAPSQAVDGDALTHWKSGPMPDPSAVVSMYVDMRAPDGTPQMMDSLYLDPVYTGQHLNVYYSSDETVTALRASPITVVPSDELNNTWSLTVGRTDSPSQGSLYQFPFSHGPMEAQNAWFGLAWRPDFPSSDAPSSDPVLLRVTPTIDVPTVFAPRLTYNAGSSRFDLRFYNGTTPITFSTGSVTFAAKQNLRIVCGWEYAADGTKSILMVVMDSAGKVISRTEHAAPTLPSVVSLDGNIAMQNFRGLMTALVIKLESWQANSDAFLANPTFYTSPEPVLPDSNGVVPSTSLDNAVYSVDWTQQEHGMGGPDASFYTGKTWTPIWKDYVAEKGTLFLPSAISAKYLKLEFTSLMQEPYPIYEAGIDVQYQVFPVTVQRASSLNISASGSISLDGGTLSASGGISVNGKPINWLDPMSVLNAANAVLRPTVQPITVETGPGYVTSSLPHTADKPLSGDFDLEVSGSAVYSRPPLEAHILAQAQYYTSILDSALAGLPEQLSVPWREFANAVPDALSMIFGGSTASTGPVKGSDYWVFPGQTLKLPTSIMEALTGLSTTISARATYDNRIRFTTTSVHRYEIKTVRRDAAIAYFAGVREVVPMVTSYINNADNDEWTFSTYMPSQWTMQNTKTYANGVIGVADGQPVGTLYKSFRTTTQFTRVHADFRDSGLVRSDDMWASATSDQLAPGAKTLPEGDIGGGMWGDSFAEWSDDVVDWGAPEALVAISVDADRSYQGRRVLRLSRAAGAGIAGVSLRQQTNLNKNVLYRLGCVIYKPVGNTNTVVLQMVRNSTQEVIHQETVPVVAGQWFTWSSSMKEYLFDDTECSVQMILSGDQAEDIYLSDLYTEIAGVRYFLQLGGSGNFNQEVTELAYRNSAYAVTQRPATECAVTVFIVSPNAYALGMTLRPTYVR